VQVHHVSQHDLLQWSPDGHSVHSHPAGATRRLQRRIRGYSRRLPALGAHSGCGNLAPDDLPLLVRTAPLELHGGAAQKFQAERGVDLNQVDRRGTQDNAHPSKLDRQPHQPGDRFGLLDKLGRALSQVQHGVPDRGTQCIQLTHSANHIFGIAVLYWDLWHFCLQRKQ